ncbi:MAG: hypothetical protein H7X97_05560 [Opitutaceae bacterium]|nr:hypothetical protein [Verrucomicrobiales bacterium]
MSKQLNLTITARRLASSTPGKIFHNALLNLGLSECTLREHIDRRKQDQAAAAIAVGGAAYGLVQIGNYFAENPDKLCNLGKDMHDLGNS